MNVNVLKTSNPYANGITNVSKKATIDKPTLTEKPKEIAITNSELKYFQKLFPENATQIEKYISFNRNGQISGSSIPKGTIVNVRV